jgi:hypothetical protein
MSKRYHERLPGELQETEARLRDERPRLDALELDRVKLRAMSAERSTQKGPLMKSRLAITTMLVLGIFMSTTGAGLAITGGTVSQDAGQEATGGQEGQTLGQEDRGDQGNGPAGATQGEDQVLGPTGGGGGEASPEDQVAATAEGGETLPFTGFLAIPLMIGGVALLGGGLVLRRRTD